MPTASPLLRSGSRKQWNATAKSRKSNPESESMCNNCPSLGYCSASRSRVFWPRPLAQHCQPPPTSDSGLFTQSDPAGEMQVHHPRKRITDAAVAALHQALTSSTEKSWGM